MEKEIKDNRDFLAKIEENIPEFSKGQKRIAAYLLEHYDKAAFMTAARLGETVGVSESTVVRFASCLGFDGYPKLQKSLQEIIRSKLTSVQRMEISKERMEAGDIMKNALAADIENIKATLVYTAAEDFEGAVESVLKAKTIYILGVRSSASLASFLGFYFNLIFENVKLIHTNSTAEMFEQIMRVGPEDTVLGISFPRYSQRTVKAMQYAADRGACVVAITDSPASPIAEYSSYALYARSDMVSFIDSLAAPMSLIGALIVGVSSKKYGELISTFEQLERIWEEYDVYDKRDSHGKI